MNAPAETRRGGEERRRRQGKQMINSRPQSKISGPRKVAIALISLLAGSGDFLTGVLLMVAPAKALALMGTPMVKEPVLLQFVGVFVGSVGASYLLGMFDWLRPGGTSARLRAVWELTVLFRIAAGLFVAVEIGAGGFATAWASVPATDLTWALLQAILLKLGFFDEKLS